MRSHRRLVAFALRLTFNLVPAVHLLPYTYCSISIAEPLGVRQTFSVDSAFAVDEAVFVGDSFVFFCTVGLLESDPDSPICFHSTVGVQAAVGVVNTFQLLKPYTNCAIRVRPTICVEKAVGFKSTVTVD